MFAAEWIRLDQLMSPLRGRGEVVSIFCSRCKPLQRIHVAAFDAPALGLHPLLEFRSVAEIKALQKPTAIEPDRRFEFSARECIRKITDVAIDCCDVQTERIRSRKDAFI